MLSACITTEETASVDSVAELRTESAPGIASIREVPRYRLPFEDNPDRLQGLSDRQMTSIFGEPGFRRKDKPAEVWRYRSPGCILDVFLYPEGKDYRVAHAEVREAAAEKTPSHCLTSIVDQRNS
jgi:hypothetical protein